MRLDLRCYPHLVEHGFDASYECCLDLWKSQENIREVICRVGALEKILF